MATPSYVIPPWLHPQDIVGQYSQGVHLGAQLAQEQQRLAAQQAQSEREHTLQQQRLEVAKAYQDQEIELRKQEIGQAQQKLQQATQAAARQYAAIQGYQQELAAGTDPLQAILKYGPLMGHQTSAEAAAIRASQMKKEELPSEVRGIPVMTPEGTRVAGMLGLPSAGGGVTVRDLPKTGDEISVPSAAMLLRALPEIDAMAGTKRGDTNSLMSTLGPDLRRRVMGALQKNQASLSGDTAAAPKRLRWNPEKGIAEPIAAAVPPEEDEANLEPVQE